MNKRNSFIILLITGISAGVTVGTATGMLPQWATAGIASGITLRMLIHAVASRKKHQ